MQELYTTFSTLEGKLWWIGRSWVFDLNKCDLCPSFVEGLATKGLGPSCGGFPYWGGADVPKALIKPITHLENLKGSFFYIKNKVIMSSFPELLFEDNKFNKKSFTDKIPLLPQMDPLSFMIQGVDGEFNYLLEGGPDENRSSTKSVNNEALVINAKPISVVHPSNIVKNIVDSHNISSDEGRLSLISPDAPLYLEEGKRSMVARKRKVTGDASSPLDVDSDPDIHEFPSNKELKDATDYHWVVAQVTPPSWKPYLREISTEQLRDTHDKAYMQSGQWPLQCTTFEEVAELKKPFVLEEMPGYRLFSKEEYDRAVAVEEAAVTSIEAFVFKGFVRMPYVDSVCIYCEAHVWLSIDTTRNLAPPDAIGSGPSISIPHCEKAYTDVIDVISCFGFLVISQALFFDTTDRDPECILHDPWCTSWMMSLDFAAPTHLNHGDKYDLRYNVPSISLYNGALTRRFLAFCRSSGSFPNCRNSQIGVIQLSSSSRVTFVTSFCVIDFSYSTFTRNSLTSLENVTEASLLSASAFLF
nr:hypothetical protein [Tanacetum cinerariifolium]